MPCSASTSAGGARSSPWLSWEPWCSSRPRLSSLNRAPPRRLVRARICVTPLPRVRALLLDGHSPRTGRPLQPSTAIVLTAIALLTAAATSRLHPASLGAATTSPHSTPPGAATVSVPLFPTIRPQRGRELMELGIHGVNPFATHAPGRTARLARLAEDLGDRSWWAGDHVALPRRRHRPGHLALPERRLRGDQQHARSVRYPVQAQKRVGGPAGIGSGSGASSATRARTSSWNRRASSSAATLWPGVWMNTPGPPLAQPAGHRVEPGLPSRDGTCRVVPADVPDDGIGSQGP